MLRLKRQDTGEVNLFIHKIQSFIDHNGGSQIVLDGGLTYDVKESPQSIRGKMKRMSETGGEEE